MPPFSSEWLEKGGVFVGGKQNLANSKAALTEGDWSVKLPVCLGRVLVVCTAIQYNWNRCLKTR
jgi:hypothetical protein